ncbi:hypothetical protein [Catellatospora citrea]|uniref:Uncharacterized protein n=1 Tax=Catellatospora citrea TaxID=53366 RepID=A0A8J3NYU9_9ACTN|nr:hypothetical protein C8E86_2391 [Catellatospora citrea]GIF95720.1 hypothetical protein Cci01nite_08140 [Catellatospora citrea]
MTASIRSRRAGGISPEEARNRPLYARVLGLQYVRPSNLMCFLFFEGTVALAVLLSLAELTGWWAVVVLPVSVAVMVKLNDVIAGATTRSGAPAARAERTATRSKTARRAPGQPAVRLRVAAPAAEPAPPPRRIERPVDDDRDPYPTHAGYGAPEGFAGRSGNGGQEFSTSRYGSGEQETYAGQTDYRAQDSYAQGGYGEPGAYVGQSGNFGDGAPSQAAPAGPEGEEPWLGTAEQRARQSAAYRYE